MSKNVTLMGASYSAVPSVILPQTGGGDAQFFDVSDTTAAATDVASGKYFYSAAGVRTQGTASGGGGKNAQISQTPGRVASTTYTATGPSLTVAKTGTYSVYWVGYRSSTSGTNGSQLYINGTAYGTAQTTFDSGSGLTNLQHVHLSGVSLTQGQTLTIRARSRGTSYYMYIQDLVIIEE